MIFLSLSELCALSDHPELQMSGSIHCSLFQEPVTTGYYSICSIWYFKSFTNCWLRLPLHHAGYGDKVNGISFALMIAEKPSFMPKLYMLLIGATPPGRNIEQHDVFFGIGNSIKELIPAVMEFWPGNNKLHFDAWREVTIVNGYKVKAVLKNKTNQSSPYKLFFINLGGYKQNEFEEFHYKMLIAATDKSAAINSSRKTAFFRHTGFKGATAHVDDKYGIDVDDVHEINDILPPGTKEKYRLMVTPGDSLAEDEIHLGYFKLGMF